MSLVQFLRILRARAWIILAATVSCLIGAFIVILILPPRWEAHSRVLLNLLKPDPVTGQVIAANATRTYVATQTELIKDYSVAGQVADQLGLLTDPVLIQQYRNRSKNDVRDFRRWLAQLIIDRTKTDIVEGSNILEITYSGTSPDNARLVADALRKAYVDSSLAFRREDAIRNADWFTLQAEKARTALDSAEVEKNAFERENGIIMQNDKTDLESARLVALASARDAVIPVAPPIEGSPPVPANASLQVAQLDAEIAQMSQTLGPNHPDLQALRGKRDAIAAIVAEQEAALAAAGKAAASKTSGAAALDRALAAQKALVISQRDKLGRLAQLQEEIDLRRDQYTKTAARVADLRREAAIADAGLTVLGGAVTPQSPAFPNKPLIYAGSVMLGMAMGVLVALLIELFNRRIRGIEDLQVAVDVPVLAVVSAARRRTPRANSRQRSRKVELTQGRKILQT